MSTSPACCAAGPPLGSVRERAVGLDLVFGSRDAPHVCSGRRRAAARRERRTAVPASGQWGRTWSSDHGTPRMPVQGAAQRRASLGGTRERAVRLDLVFGSRDAPHVCSGCRPAASVTRRHPRAGSGAGPGLRITGRSACLFRAPPSGRTSPLVRRNRKAHARDDRANFAHLPCELLAPVTAHSLPTPVPLVGPAAARALQLGPSSHRRRSRCSQDVASRTHACGGGTTVLLTSAWHAEAHGSLRGWLGAAGSAFPSHKVPVVCQMPFLLLA